MHLSSYGEERGLYGQQHTLGVTSLFSIQHATEFRDPGRDRHPKGNYPASAWQVPERGILLLHKKTHFIWMTIDFFKKKIDLG